LFSVVVRVEDGGKGGRKKGKKVCVEVVRHFFTYGAGKKGISRRKEGRNGGNPIQEGKDRGERRNLHRLI